MLRKGFICLMTFVIVILLGFFVKTNVSFYRSLAQQNYRLKPGEAIIIKYPYRQKLDFSKIYIYTKVEQANLDKEFRKIKEMNAEIKSSKTVIIYEDDEVGIIGVSNE